MSLGAIQLNSLFRKYTGQLSDISMAEADQTRNYQSQIRDLDTSQRVGQKKLSERKATQGMANSGTALEERTNLDKSFIDARSDLQGNYNSNLAKLAKQRLDAKADYDENVALVNLTELLKKGGQ